VDVSRAPLNALNAVGSGARSVVSRIEEALDHLEDLVAGVRAMERELSGMRRDVRALGKKVDGLRGDVQAMHAGVDGIRDATQSLDQRFHEVPDRLARVEEGIGGLATSLESVDALAARLGRFARRNRRARAAPEEEAQEAQAAALDGRVASADPEASPDGPEAAEATAAPPPILPDDRTGGQ
jgi:chromosome segregation ATPase